ncbi:hypothetical protein GIB67_008140, partial [Kingdonia uniflora]
FRYRGFLNEDDLVVRSIVGAALGINQTSANQLWIFEDIFDVDHFGHLKNDVRIIPDVLNAFLTNQSYSQMNDMDPCKDNMYFLYAEYCRRTLKIIPKYAPAQFSIDYMLPRIKKKKRMALKPFVDRIGYDDNAPQRINRLRVLHLRFEKGIVNLSRDQKAKMAEYGKKKSGLKALQKRKEGRCPLEPEEVSVILMEMGYPKETQIYVAIGQVYGGQNRMAPLMNMFHNLVNKYCE